MKDPETFVQGAETTAISAHERGKTAYAFLVLACMALHLMADAVVSLRKIAAQAKYIGRSDRE